MSLIEFTCDVSETNSEYIKNILPKKRTKVMEVRESKNLLSVRLYTECTKVEEIKSWLKEYEEITKTNYTIRNTANSTGRYVRFKQTLNCHHKTRCKKLLNVSLKNRTKNTNCPSTITITLHAIKKRYQGKNIQKYLLYKDLPCEISLILSHNHDIDSVDALKYRKVSNETKEKLLELFRSGHSATTAREMLKIEICSTYENPELILMDRSYYPNYMYCYHLYMLSLPGAKPRKVITYKTDLIEKLEEYNEKLGTNCVQMVFTDSEYTICICLPLMKRVHKYIETSSEIVYVDSLSWSNDDEGRVFMLLTHSIYGGLPLAVIITSSINCDLLKAGFLLLKNMLGDEIFGGNPEGPKIFVTEDCFFEETAITDTWPNSKCLLSTFHVLQSVWKWLGKPQNKIQQDDQYSFFEEFKLILYAKSVNNAIKQYEIAKKNAANYPLYINYLQRYWERKEQWGMAYRIGSDTSEEYTNNLLEVIMQIIKGKLFSKVKAVDVIKMIEFIFTEFEQYYKNRLLDFSKNRLRKNILGKNFKKPSQDLFERIQILSDSIVIVPSEKEQNLHYMVNIDTLVCSCSSYNAEELCKHIHWACMILYSENYYTNIYNDHIKNIFQMIATGNNNNCDPLALSDQIPTTNEASSSSSSSLHLDNYINYIVPNSNFEVEIKEELTDQCLERGQIAIEKLNKVLTQFLEKNPTPCTINGLEKMCEHAETLQTSAQFLSSCSNFALRYRRRNRFKVPMHVSFIRSRKENLRRRNRLMRNVVKSTFCNNF